MNKEGPGAKKTDESVLKEIVVRQEGYEDEVARGQ